MDLSIHLTRDGGENIRFGTNYCRRLPLSSCASNLILTIRIESTHCRRRTSSFARFCRIHFHQIYVRSDRVENDRFNKLR